MSSGGSLPARRGVEPPRTVWRGAMVSGRAVRGAFGSSGARSVRRAQIPEWRSFMSATIRDAGECPNVEHGRERRVEDQFGYYAEPRVACVKLVAQLLKS